MRILVAFALCSIGFAQSTPEQRAAWNQPVKPFRIIGNIYYVGAANVSSFFIKTPDGAVLLDGGLPETAPLIEKNIAALGFSITDVKFLLNSHAHFDHCGGLAELKKLSGARMIASERDRPVLESAKGGAAPFPAAAVDRVIAEGDFVVVQYTFRGTNTGPWRGFPATAKPVERSGIIIFRIVEGKIVEEWLAYDGLTIYRQLGLTPPS